MRSRQRYRRLLTANSDDGCLECLKAFQTPCLVLGTVDNIRQEEWKLGKKVFFVQGQEHIGLWCCQRWSGWC